MKLRVLLACMALSLSPLFFGGCASAPKDENGNDRLSTIPWNTPAKWERQMPIGGAAY